MLRCLADLRLPLRDPALADVDGLLAGLEEFRQHLGGRLTVTMLGDVGRPIDVHEVDPAPMRAAIESVAATARSPSRAGDALGEITLPGTGPE